MSFTTLCIKQLAHDRSANATNVAKFLLELLAFFFRCFVIRLFQRSELRLDVLLLSTLFVGQLFQPRTFVASISILRVVQNRENTKVLFLRDVVVLVVVTLSTAHRQAHPHLHRRVDSIDDRSVTEFFVVGSALAVCHRVAMECRRDQLFLRGLRKHVARELLDGELIERFVFVVGIDHPIAITPDRASWILSVARRVRIASDIEPNASPSLAVRWRRQQLLDQLLVRVWVGAFDERIDLLWCRRQARDRKGYSANQCGSIRDRIRCQTSRA